MRYTIIFGILLLATQVFTSSCSASKESKSTETAETSTMEVSRAEAYTLQYNPPVGKTGKLTMSINYDIDMQTMGQTMKSKQEIIMAADIAVTENTTEKITSTLAYDYAKIEMDVPMMGKVEYDTRKEDNTGMMAATLGEAFGKMVEQKIVLEQDHTGKTINISGMEQLGGAQQGQTAMNISSIMSMSQFPATPIKVGESWKNEVQDNNAQFNIDATYTLTKVENNKAFINVEADLSLSSSANVENTDTPSDMKGKQSGTFIYELETMWLIEAIMQQDMNMEVEQMGMTIPMQMKGNIILTME